MECEYCKYAETSELEGQIVLSFEDFHWERKTATRCKLNCRSEMMNNARGLGHCNVFRLKTDDGWIKIDESDASTLPDYAPRRVFTVVHTAYWDKENHPHISNFRSRELGVYIGGNRFQRDHYNGDVITSGPISEAKRDVVGSYTRVTHWRPLPELPEG